MTLSSATDAAAAAAEAVLEDLSKALAAEHAESVRAAARAAAVTANAVLVSPTATRAPARRIGGAPLEWFLTVRARGRKRVPLPLDILRQKALQVAEHLGITDFAASIDSIQRLASRHGVVNVALH